MLPGMMPLAEYASTLAWLLALRVTAPPLEPVWTVENSAGITLVSGLDDANAPLIFRTPEQVHLLDPGSGRDLIPPFPYETTWTPVGAAGTLFGFDRHAVTCIHWRASVPGGGLAAARAWTAVPPIAAKSIIDGDPEADVPLIGIAPTHDAVLALRGDGQIAVLHADNGQCDITRTSLPMAGPRLAARGDDVGVLYRQADQLWVAFFDAAASRLSLSHRSLRIGADPAPWYVYPSPIGLALIWRHQWRWMPWPDLASDDRTYSIPADFRGARGGVDFAVVEARSKHNVPGDPEMILLGETGAIGACNLRTGVCREIGRLAPDDSAVCNALQIDSDVIVVSGHQRVARLPLQLDRQSAPASSVPMRPALRLEACDGRRSVWSAASTGQDERRLWLVREDGSHPGGTVTEAMRVISPSGQPSSVVLNGNRLLLLGPNSIEMFELGDALHD